MANVHRLIPDPGTARRPPRAGGGGADVVILPCVRRERPSERAALRGPAERAGAPAAPPAGEDAAP